MKSIGIALFFLFPVCALARPWSVFRDQLQQLERKIQHSDNLYTKLEKLKDFHAKVKREIAKRKEDADSPKLLALEADLDLITKDFHEENCNHYRSSIAVSNLNPTDRSASLPDYAQSLLAILHLLCPK